MAIYRTLGPITYVNGSVVESIDRAGVRVDLSPAQAEALAGMVALDHTGDLELPRAIIVVYDSAVFFPKPGYEQYLYLAKDTGVLYRWQDTDFVPLVIGGGGTVNTVNGKGGADVVLDADDILDGATNHKFATAAQLAKIDSVETGAEVNNISDANATDLTDGGASTLHYHAADRDRANHSGTQSADTIVDGSTNKAYTAAEKTKLSNIASGATAYTNADADARVAAAIGVTVQAYDADLTAFAAKTAPAGAVVGTTDIQTLGGKTLTSPVVNNPTLTNYIEAAQAISNSGTAKTFDLSTGTIIPVTMTGNCTFTMPGVGAGKSFLVPIYTGAGGFTGTFTGVKWPGGTPPTLTTTAARLDLVSFFSDGTNWYGSIVQNFTP